MSSSRAKCPVCGWARQAATATVDGRTLMMCERCRHITWQTMPTEAELTAFYSNAYTDMHGQTELQASHTAYYRSHAEEMAGLVQKPVAAMAIADVGCSIPVFLEQAVALGCTRAIGVDWSEEARAYGAQRGVRVVNPGAFLTEVPDGSLDVLRYSHVLEHLTDPLAVLRSQVRKLKRGGLLYITQPNLPMLRFGQAPAPYDNAYPTHLQFFTPASLIRLVEAAGCGVERFFTVADPEQHSAVHGTHYDLDAALTGAAVTAERGEALRGVLNNFPFHFGRNSAMYARAGQRTVAPPAPPRTTDALSRLLANRLGGGALAYAVGSDAEAARLLQAGCARVVTFGPGGPPQSPGIERAGKAAGAAPGMQVLDDGRAGALGLMRRVLGSKPDARNQIEVTTLDAFAAERDEAPGLISIAGPPRPVLAGATELFAKARPLLMFSMADADIAGLRPLLEGPYEVIRLRDESWALEPRGGGAKVAEPVLAFPRA